MELSYGILHGALFLILLKKLFLIQVKSKFVNFNINIWFLLIFIFFLLETSNQPATRQVSVNLHETINSIENLLDINHYNGCIQRFYDLVERCSDARPVIINHL